MMLKVKLLSPDAQVPTCANPGEDLGFDLYAAEDVVLYPEQVTKVKTGVAAFFDSQALPFKVGDTTVRPEFGLLIRDRSSMASKGIAVRGGVVDAGYRGEIIVMLTLDERNPDGLRYVSYEIHKGDKIAQMIPMRVYTFGEPTVVDELPEASRGTAGFGSTGR